MCKKIPMMIVLMLAGLSPLTSRAELKIENGVKMVPPAANVGAVAAAEQASTIRETRKTGGDTLRCWQKGRLLYEGNGFRAPSDRGPNTISVPRTSNGDTVTVFDLKDGLCILSKQ
jgi:hypothetical protein